MSSTVGVCRQTVLGLLIVAASAAATLGQDLADDMVGQTRESWALWRSAMDAVDRGDAVRANEFLTQVVDLDLSELRLALMADRTGSVRLEQLAEGEDAGFGIKTVAASIQAGRRQKQLAEDGWHFAAIGRFKYADANFKALDQSSPDPVALLELSRRNPNRHLILVKLVASADVGPSARRMIELLDEGEERLRTDPYEIALNIEKLGGTPRMVFRATQALVRSGEYAVPHLIQFLQDAKQGELHPAIVKVLPKLGRGGLNPLCMALGMSDSVTKQVLITALGQIGYRQALPYLVKLANSETEQADVRSAAREAIRTIGASFDHKGSELFQELAEAYYRNDESLRADSRFDRANVWYLVKDRLRYVPVPTRIFNDIMSMRCCEEALGADTSNTDATALWLAANFRREARLGLDVESDEPDARADADATRSAKYPRAIYFARAAGPMYNHRVLARAVRDRDPGVALGAIAALSVTAGEPSLVGGEDVKQALVEALSFPNRQVRIKTALALALALPKTPFDQSQNVLPVLDEALSQSGRLTALIADPDDNSRNRFQALLRSAGFECAVGPTVFAAKSAADDANISSFDVILIASDVTGPDLVHAIGDLRKQFETAATPILIVSKGGDVSAVGDVDRAFAGTEILLAEVLDLGDPERMTKIVTDKFHRASRALGMSVLDEALSLDLALRTAAALRGIAENGGTVFDFKRAVDALIKALDNRSVELRISCAHTLALAALPKAQASIADVALDAERPQTERVKAFGSLAESARRNGNLLGGEHVQQLIQLTMTEENLVLRSAASKALGALDLPTNKASEIIRNQSRG
ncbi:MAG: HEAT repeat domain-containing protein [Phycisphaerae bacterium]